jgi:hypothetical protein
MKGRSLLLFGFFGLVSFGWVCVTTLAFMELNLWAKLALRKVVFKNKTKQKSLF